VGSNEQVQVLLQKSKAALTRLFALIFPKLDQDKTLGQLVDAFFVDTDGTIEVFKRNSCIYRVLLAFQLLMGYGFKADLSTFSRPAHKCARQLLELVEAHKMQTAPETAPSASTQTQAP
jgi:hypothetical protein